MPLRDLAQGRSSRPRARRRRWLLIIGTQERDRGEKQRRKKEWKDSKAKERKGSRDSKGEREREKREERREKGPAA